MNLKHKITVLTANLLLGGFVEKRTYEYEAGKEDVYLFSGPKVAGMNVFWGDILLNERIFEEGNEDLLQYIFYHEKGHQKENPVWQALHGGIRYLITPLALTLHTILLGTLTYITSANRTITVLTPNLAKSLIPAQIAIIASAIILSYIGEFGADFHALHEIGEERFRRAHEQYDATFPDRSTLQTIFMRLTHPPESMVLKLFNKLQ